MVLDLWIQRLSKRIVIFIVAYFLYRSTEAPQNQIQSPHLRSKSLQQLDSINHAKEYKIVEVNYPS